MNIDLSKHEIEIIDQALGLWESQAHTDAMIGTLMGAMLCPKEERENYKDGVRKDIEQATVNSKGRRMQSVMLKAKLYQALNRASEHEIEAKP